MTRHHHALAVALLLAGAASAQTLAVSTNTVTFNSFVNSVPITVTSTGDNFQFTIGAHSSKSAAGKPMQKLETVPRSRSIAASSS